MHHSPHPTHKAVGDGMLCYLLFSGLEQVWYYKRYFMLMVVLPVEFLTCICSLCALYGGGGSGGGTGAHILTERERAKEIVNLHIKYF